MFIIKVRDIEQEDGIFSRINASQIKSYHPVQRWFGNGAGEIGTRITFIDGEPDGMVVHETPEEIDAKIERVTNQTIGGGH